MEGQAHSLSKTPTCLPWQDKELETMLVEIYSSQALCQPANSPSRCVRVISSQGSCEWSGNNSGTCSSILNTVIFIWRLTLAAASPPAAVYSSRIMEIVSWRLQQKHYAQLVKPSLWDMTSSNAALL